MFLFFIPSFCLSFFPWIPQMWRLWDVGKSEPIKVGKASPCEGTLPGAIYFILKYKQFKSAAQANAMVGGDNASRAIPIGTTLNTLLRCTVFELHWSALLCTVLVLDPHSISFFFSYAVFWDKKNRWQRMVITSYHSPHQRFSTLSQPIPLKSVRFFKESYWERTRASEESHHTGWIKWRRLAISIDYLTNCLWVQWMPAKNFKIRWFCPLFVPQCWPASWFAFDISSADLRIGTTWNIERKESRFLKMSII